MEFTSFAGNKRTIGSDVARRADFNEIPLISLALPKEELLAKLRDACTRVGFLYISDHGVPQDKINDLFQTAEKFFEQEKEKKNEINYKKSQILRGYEPPAEVRTDETRKPDLNEAFNWGYEKTLDPLWAETDEQPGTTHRGERIPIFETEADNVQSGKKIQCQVRMYGQTCQASRVSFQSTTPRC
jgi:isopenicillin N synthase-like dioxygenase